MSHTGNPRLICPQQDTLQQCRSIQFLDVLPTQLQNVAISCVMSVRKEQLQFHLWNLMLGNFHQKLSCK